MHSLLPYPWKIQPPQFLQSENCGGGRRDAEQSALVLNKSLILAQGERWRRA